LSNVIRGDVYRFGKSKLFYGIAAFTSVFAFFLVMVIRQDIRFGISVFGDLIAFREIGDIIRIGAEYEKGLGILVAVLISVFIGQEYQWKTWQHKWVTNRSRSAIYLSKALLSSVISVIIFLLYQTVVLLSSWQVQQLLTVEYAVMIACSVFIYAALGTVICLLAMLIKNNTASAIICIGYVLFTGTLMSAIKNIASYSNIAERLVQWGIQHSIYGMSSLVRNASLSLEIIAPILLNSVIIMILSTAIGMSFFKKCEL